jgi:hypothetical protein
MSWFLLSLFKIKIMQKVKVILKNGEIIEVLPNEVEGLKKAGVLKESKIPSKTKEEKETGETKDEKAAMEKMYPKSNRPADISKANIKGGSPKKVK